MRLDPASLPATSADSRRRVFESEDMAGRVFAPVARPRLRHG